MASIWVVAKSVSRNLRKKSWVGVNRRVEAEVVGRISIDLRDLKVALGADDSGEILQKLSFRTTVRFGFSGFSRCQVIEPQTRRLEYVSSVLISEKN